MTLVQARRREQCQILGRAYVARYQTHVALQHPQPLALYRATLERRREVGTGDIGRASVVEETALPEALDKGWLRAAALDVFATEPLPADSPLWSDPRVMVSPHISGLTTIDGAAHGFLECLEALERGELPKWVVDRTRGY